MADYDLNPLTLKELKQLSKDVAKAISSYEDRQKAEALARVDAVAKEMGYSLSELIGIERKKLRAPAVPKFLHPENPSMTWSGRGRKPRWFVDALATGKTEEELSIH